MIVTDHANFMVVIFIFMQSLNFKNKRLDGCSTACCLCDCMYVWAEIGNRHISAILMFYIKSYSSGLFQFIF